jgi:hypothetical protein
VGFIIFNGIYFSLAFGITFFFIFHIFVGAVKLFAFREWALFLYSLNYLLSPTFTYQLNQDLVLYPMKISANDYFEVALPGFICFYLGMHFFKTSIFKPRISKIIKDTRDNETLLRNFVLWGIVIYLIRPLFPTEFAFLLYLISQLRFVGAFALYCFNSTKYGVWVLLLLLFELYNAAIYALYHDAIMWILFFVLFYVYVKNPSIPQRLIGLSGLIILVLFIQGLKGIYRSKVSEVGKSDISLVYETSSDVKGDIGSEENLLSTLNRGNQAWIFASAKERMDRIGDYQGLHILGIYLEAALLPRVLAPNKITSGDKKIFNTFSGHQINQNTSMGLGVFADGYIAYGYWGVLFFTFGLGLLFNLTFRIIESWAKLSEFYVLMVLPLLNYAIRPDCELQTTINHLVKGLIVFGILVTLTKFNFVMSGRSSAKVKRSVIPLIE